MSEVKKIATRESYGNALVELGTAHDNVVVLDADLAAATKTGIFKKAFPQRHIDCGIAECNMMGIAAGLSLTGKVPFASSFAMFAAGRAFEQVRNTIGYPKLNVKIGATHAGISVGEDGATHQCNEDIALMRTIPNMVIINPADDVEAKAAVQAAYEHVGPVYLRFGRLAAPVINMIFFTLFWERRSSATSSELVLLNGFVIGSRKKILSMRLPFRLASLNVRIIARIGNVAATNL